MVVISVLGQQRMVARNTPGVWWIFRWSSLGNLAGSFRQSASTLGLVGCAVVQPAPAAAPLSSAGQATPTAQREAPAGAEPIRDVSREAPDAAPQPTTLDIPGFEPCVIRLSPLRQPAPLFVVAHGAGGQARWHCHHYEAMLGPAAVLLCLTGKRMVARDPARGYYYPDHIQLSSELTAATTAIRAAHAADLRGDSGVYLGYSQGATMGALAIAEYGADFTRLALVEGGFDSWSATLARRLKNNGGQRVLFVCGTDHCRNRASTAATILATAGLDTKMLYAAHAGHRPDGPVAARVREGLQWLLEGDSRYAEILSHLQQGDGTSVPSAEP